MAFLLISVKSEKIDHGFRLRALYPGIVRHQEGDQRLQERRRL